MAILFLSEDPPCKLSCLSWTVFVFVSFRLVLHYSISWQSNLNNAKNVNVAVATLLISSIRNEFKFIGKLHSQMSEVIDTEGKGNTDNQTNTK